MTGEKNRGTTQEKLWNLDDKTLATPAHDELVLKLLNKEYVMKLFPELKEILEEKPIITINEEYIRQLFFKWGRYRCGEYHYNDINIVKEKLSHLLKPLFEDNKPLSKEIINIIHSLYTGSDFDETNIQSNWQLLKNEYVSVKTFDVNRKLSILSEVPQKGYNDFIVGYWDILLEINEIKKDSDNFSKIFKKSILKEIIFNGRVIHKPLRYYIEVKPKIDSFGAVLRQLKTYETYLNKNLIQTILFTPDLRFKDAFESQGIKVISPLMED